MTNITPKNGANFPWTGKDLDKFEKEWSMKPVELKGFMDHSKESTVERTRNGEKGVEFVTPFYTHLNDKDEPCGILVNRGWVPIDLAQFRYDKAESDNTKITGILYRGDNQHKYSKPNQPA